MADTTRRIIGVVEDTHYEGLQKEVRPLLLRYGHDYEFGFYEARIAGGAIQEAVRHVQDEWEAVYPNDPFDYFFLDRFFDAQYQNDRTFGKVFGVFSVLAIFVAVLGLFGLVTFTTYQKTKEIGIRKVLGASVADIIGLITRKFFVLILIASVLALPLAHMVIQDWLNTFAYRVPVAWWWYGAPVLIINGIALLAVSRQSLKAALSNPVDAIKET
jgi:putative ABC transport system permease protein